MALAIEGAVSDTVANTAEVYLQAGVLGATVLILLIVSSVLLYIVIRDRATNKKFAESLEKAVENQKNALKLQEEAEKHNRELLNIVSEINQIERENTKVCYEKIENQLKQLVIYYETDKKAGK